MQKSRLNLQLSLSVCLLLVSFLFLPSQEIKAQTRVGIQALVGIPDDAFAENVEVPLAGLSMTYLRKLGRSPISLGLGAGFLAYGYDCWTETRGVNSAVVESQYEVYSSVANLDVRMRLEPRVNVFFQPYGEVFAGGSLLSTTFTIEDLDLPECDAVVYEEVLSRDAAFTYGAGFGVLVPVQGHFLDLGATYRNSGRAQYMNRDFDRVYNTRSNMWMFHIGITFCSD